jgi:hypothetical protein
MGNKRLKKSPKKPKRSNVIVAVASAVESIHPTALEIADLAVDLWKLGERTKTEGATERIVAAFERAEDRLKRIGFEWETLVGKNYNTNLKAKVVDHEASEGPLVISKCISPAVYFRGSLIREAEIVTIGGENNL